ncbi:potassium channel family protein [Halobacterium wangiae]|uniref:potassium channel family protein n=1 Tax=Halobacterium wangiae TaxID=2902623 RepID=UPI001E3EFAAF|nr:potassium channel family protein [Halobacterium wangiae]
MSVVTLVVGLVLLVGVVVDLLWTIVWVEGGAGPLTARLMSGTWRVLRRVGSRESRLLELGGPLVLGAGFVVWTAGLWGGWTLVFASAGEAIADAFGARTVGWGDLVYFTGYVFFTLGNGDFVPRGTVWQVATTLAAGSGMLFVTLSVTYVLSVLGAVTQKRTFAKNVSGLGERGTEVLRRSWDGERFSGLRVPLNTVATQLNTLTANHMAYPVLHYFYTRQSDRAPTTSVAVLDETLTLFQHGVPEADRPGALLLAESRSSVGEYLQTVGSAYVEPAEEAPPGPDLDALREAGVPTVSDEAFADALADLEERRRRLLGLVRSDEHEWPNTRES